MTLRVFRPNFRASSCRPDNLNFMLTDSLHMDQNNNRKMNFFEALVGLLFEPGTTIENLLPRENPPYSITFFLCLVLTIFVPVLAQVIKYDLPGFMPASLLSLGVFVFVTIFSFMLLEGLILAVLRFRFSLAQMVAIVTYSIVPFILALWLIFLFNYFTNGNLTLVTYLLTGLGEPDDRFLRVVPIALGISMMLTGVNFYYCVRLIGDTLNTTAICITIISIVPFLVACLLGLYGGELAREGTRLIYVYLFWQ